MEGESQDRVWKVEERSFIFYIRKLWISNVCLYSIVAQVSDVVPEPLVIQVDPNSTIFTTFHKHSLDSIYFRTLNCVN